MNDREIFRENLNYYLASTGKLQRELAEYVGAKYTTVSGWTRGVSYPRADAMEKIANFFGVPTSQLIGKRGSKDPSLSPDETVLIEGYRDLPDPGKQYMLQQLTAAKAIYGEKELPSSAAATSESC